MGKAAWARAKAQRGAGCKCAGALYKQGGYILRASAKNSGYLFRSIDIGGPNGGGGDPLKSENGFLGETTR